MYICCALDSKLHLIIFLWNSSILHSCFCSVMDKTDIDFTDTAYYYCYLLKLWKLTFLTLMHWLYNFCQYICIYFMCIFVAFTKMTMACLNIMFWFLLICMLLTSGLFLILGAPDVCLVLRLEGYRIQLYWPIHTISACRLRASFSYHSAWGLLVQDQYLCEYLSFYNESLSFFIKNFFGASETFNILHHKEFNFGVRPIGKIVPYLSMREVPEVWLPACHSLLYRLMFIYAISVCQLGACFQTTIPMISGTPLLIYKIFGQGFSCDVVLYWDNCVLYVCFKKLSDFCHTEIELIVVTLCAVYHIPVTEFTLCYLPSKLGFKVQASQLILIW